MAVYRRTDTKTKRWYYKFTLDGRTYKETIPTARNKRQAEEAEREAVKRIHEGLHSNRSSILFSDFVRDTYTPWAKEHHTAFHLDERFCETFTEHFKGYRLSQITSFHIEGYKQKRIKTPKRSGAKRAARSINLELAFLSKIFSLAVKYKLARENPCKGVERLPVIEDKDRVLEHEEELTLLQRSQEPECPDWLMPLIKLATRTGFRMIELVELEVANVDFERNLIFVSNPKWKRDPRKTKGNPMTKDVRELVHALCLKARSGKLFKRETGKPLTKSSVTYWFKTVCNEAEIKGVTFHSCRHTFGTRLGEAGIGIEKIARLMGHSNIKQTLRYVHPSDDALLIAAQAASGESLAQNRTGRQSHDNVIMLKSAVK